MSRLNARWAVGVVIPARNEDATIAASVASTRAALASCTQLLDAWIVVVCDTCADETASHARQALEDAGEIIECSAGTVGQARAIGVDAVSMRFQQFSPDRVWIANTDADTTVPPDWIARQLPFADKGWAAIAGIVRVDSIEGDYGTIEEVFADYAVGDDGSHYHVHGANLGVRADAYESVGAWRHVALAEDHCLWSRLKAGKWPILSTSDVVVTTSGRLTGRAVGGFADTLRAKIASLVAKPRESACEKLEGMRVSPRRNSAGRALPFVLAPFGRGVVRLIGLFVWSRCLTWLVHETVLVIDADYLIIGSAEASTRIRATFPPPPRR